MKLQDADHAYLPGGYDCSVQRVDEVSWKCQFPLSTCSINNVLRWTGGKDSVSVAMDNGPIVELLHSQSGIAVGRMIPLPVERIPDVGGGHAWAGTENPFLAVAMEDSVVILASNSFRRIQSYELTFIAKDIDVCPHRHHDSDVEEKYLCAVAGGNGVEIYKIHMKDTVRHEPVVIHRKFPICQVRFSPNGQFLGVACIDGNIGIWAVRDARFVPVRDLWTHQIEQCERITSLEFSPDSKRMCVATWNGQLHVFHFTGEMDESSRSDLDMSKWLYEPPVTQISTMAPVKYSGDEYGCYVGWLPNAKTVVVAMPGYPVLYFVDVDTGAPVLILDCSSVLTEIRGLSCPLGSGNALWILDESGSVASIPVDRLKLPTDQLPPS